MSNMQDREYSKKYNIIDMGLGFSAMIRLFQKGSKEKLHRKIMEDIERIFRASGKADFDKIHAAFCKWGVGNIVLAEKKKDTKVIKESGPASYGQIAKTLDVVMKVAIYYSYLPNPKAAPTLMPFLNAAVDDMMMQMLRKDYENQLTEWPRTLEEVNERKYNKLQDIVRQFIKDRHNGQIMPVQFDDIYWKQLNRDN